MEQTSSYNEKVMEVEPYGVEKIPYEERHGSPRQMFSLWFAVSLNISTWFTGFLGIQFGLSLKYAILALIIGNLLGAAYLALSASIGAELGRPLIPASTKVFGRFGVVGLSFLNLINNIGWLAVNLGLAVMAVQAVLNLEYHIALIAVTAITLIVAIFGYNFIHVFAEWMSKIVAVLFGIMTIITIFKLHSNVIHIINAKAGFNFGIFILAIAVTFSYQISYCPVGSDYTRYLPEASSKKKIWLFSFLGAFSACMWLELLGTLTATLGTGATPMSFLAKFMGAFTVPAVITVIISIIPSNAMAMYSGGLAAMAMGIKVKRWILALLTAVIGAVLIAFGNGSFTEIYTNFLLLLSYWIVPWLGVVLSNFYYEKKTGKKVSVGGWSGLVAFFCGIILSIPFMNSALYVGVFAKYLKGGDISYLISLIVGICVYLFILKAVEVKKM